MTVNTQAPAPGSTTETYLAQGNAALRNGDFLTAIDFFNKAKVSMPTLKEVIDFNISLAEKKISKLSKLNNLVCNSADLSNEEFKVFEKVIEYKKIKQKKPKLAVYTCISGGYDSLITPESLNSEWDYILFTDAELLGQSNFQVRPLPYEDLDPVRMARFVKLNPHIVLPDYEYTIWIDGNVLLKNNGFVDYINQLISSDVDICFRKHPHRDCVYDEIKKCQELKKDDLGIMQRQTEKYKSLNFPNNFGLFETNVIFRKKTAATEKFNSLWWKELSAGSRRDQLSVSYAIKCSNINFKLFNEPCDIRIEENPWYFIYSHTPSKNKKQIKYVQPSFYSLKTPAIVDAKREFNTLKFSNKYSSYKPPYQVLRVVQSARTTGNFHNYIDRLEEITTKFPQFESDVLWQKIIYFIQVGNFELAKHELKDTKKLAKIKNEALKFYIKIFRQEIFREESNYFTSQSLSTSDSTELYCSLLKNSLNSGEKIEFLNQIFNSYGLQPVKSFISENENATIDDLFPSKPIHRHSYNQSEPLVSIIIPAFNASSTIRTTLYSLISQTWTNLEIIVVDDNSTDETCDIVSGFSKYDARVKLLKNNKNQGPYVLRNMALKICKGEFVTVADADDWNHPDKISIQASQLVGNKELIANVACWIRVNNELNPIRRGNPFYKHLNISSLMFRRESIKEKLGDWIEVRFGGDTEFYKRLIKVFGRESVYELDAVTSLGRVEEGSLTNNETFGYFGYPFGARKEYLEIYEAFHLQASLEDLNYSDKNKKFPIPKPMDPKITELVTRCQTVILGDFRVNGSATLLIGKIEELKTQHIEFCVVQMNDNSVDPRAKIDLTLRLYLNNSGVSLSVFGEKIICDEVLVYDPILIFSENNYLPEISCRRVSLIHTAYSIQKANFSNFEVEKKWADYLCSPVQQFFLDMASRNIYQSLVEPRNNQADYIKNINVLQSNLIILNVSESKTFEYKGSNIHCIVMPCIDLELGKKTAEILIQRAGMNLTVVIAFDDLRQGFIKTLNEVSNRVIARFISFVAQDAFPGRDWLKLAHESIEQHQAGLLAFNDGKWQGRIASFGMVRKSWISKFYNSEILSSAYRSHKADNEITVIAKLDNSYVYCPESVLIEVDYQKDAGGSNSADDLVFRTRFNDGFGVFDKRRVEQLRKEYKVKAF